MSVSGVLSRVLTGTGISGVVAPITANSDWENAIGDVTTQTKAGMTNAYYTTIEGINSVALVGQTWQPTQVNQSFMVGQIDASVYQVFAPWMINTTDSKRLDMVLANSNAGGSSVEFLKSLCKQGVGLKLRLMALWGIGANEGILDGASTYDIGNNGGNTTAVTFDTFWFAQKLSLGIQKVLTATKNTASHISLLTSIDMYNYLVQTTITSTNYISTGSAVTIADYLKKVVESHGREFHIGFDATLKNADSTSTKDAILINAPGVRLDSSAELKEASEYKINSFALNANSVPFNTTMDVGEKYEYQDPTARGIMSGAFEVTATCGVTLRADTALVSYVQYQ